MYGPPLVARRVDMWNGSDGSKRPGLPGILLPLIPGMLMSVGDICANESAKLSFLVIQYEFRGARLTVSCDGRQGQTDVCDAQCHPLTRLSTTVDTEAINQGSGVTLTPDSPMPHRYLRWVVGTSRSAANRRRSGGAAGVQQTCAATASIPSTTMPQLASDDSIRTL